MRSDFAFAPFALTGPSAGGCGEERAYVRAFITARLSVLAAGFVLLPLLMVAAPNILGDMLGVFVALVVSAALGLAGLVYLSPVAAVAGSLAALAALTVGPWPDAGGLAAAATVLVAGALDIGAMPARHPRRLVLVLCGAASAVVAAVALRVEFNDGVAIWFAALPLLLVAPMITLVLALRYGRHEVDTALRTAAREADRGERLLDGARAAILVVDQGGHVLDASRYALDLLDVEWPVLRGRGLIDRTVLSDRPDLLKALATLASGETACVSLRLRIGTPEEGEAPVLHRLEARVFAPSGKESHLTLSLHEAREAALPAAPAPAADEADLYRLAVHEIRTPLNALLGFSALLGERARDGATDTRMADAARMVQRAAQDVRLATDALLDLVGSDARGVPAPVQSADLREIAAAALAVTGRDGRAPMAFVEAAPGEYPLVTDIDAMRRLIAAFAGAFGNALEGAAPVRCRLQRLGADYRLVIEAGRPLGMPASAQRPVAHLGLVEALAMRLARELGATIDLHRGGDDLCVSIDVPRSPSQTDPQLQSSAAVVPLRKSA